MALKKKKKANEESFSSVRYLYIRLQACCRLLSPCRFIPSPIRLQGYQMAIICLKMALLRPSDCLVSKSDLPIPLWHLGFQAFI